MSGANYDLAQKAPKGELMEPFRTMLFSTSCSHTADGRGPSIWDWAAHNVDGYILDGSTLDVVDNHYYMYKEDIARIKAMGINSYSYTVSWSRVYPVGNGEVDEAGPQFYKDLTDECIRQGLEPVVTLFHWDV